MILLKQYTAKGWSINDISTNYTERKTKLTTSFVNSSYLNSLICKRLIPSHLTKIAKPSTPCLQIIIRQDRFVMHALIHEANMCHISAKVKIKIA